MTKKYDKAKTPYQRLLLLPNLSEEVKTNLKNQYEKLDPIALLKDLERLQNNFWQQAWKEQTENPTTEVNIKNRTTYKRGSSRNSNKCSLVTV